MDRASVMRLAGECGITGFSDGIERFAALVVQAEREACAKACEGKVKRPVGYGDQWEGYGSLETDKTGPECAEAVRAHSESGPS